MSDWRESLKRELIDLLVDQGSPLAMNRSERSMFYGWTAEDSGQVREHVEHAGVDYERSDYVEDEWHEFMGTLYEGDTRVYGVRLHLVLLDDTLYEWRWAGHPGELILHLTRGS